MSTPDVRRPAAPEAARERPAGPSRPVARTAHSPVGVVAAGSWPRPAPGTGRQE